MNEIMMGKPKKVGDSVMVTELDDDMVVLGTPTVAKNPVTGNLDRISEVVKVLTETTCPKCKARNDPGVEITFLETGYFVYACPSCNQFVWCRIKDKKGDVKP